MKKINQKYFFDKKLLVNKSILITGGTGSFGKAFIEYIVKKKIKFKKIVILSRDEFKQFNLQNNIPKSLVEKFRFFLGDIRDKERLIYAFENIDYVIHAAALKQVPTAEYNPLEFIKTNIIGTSNVIEACLKNNIKKALLLSTDKASSPINLYGATKLCADKLFVSSNNIKGKRKIKFSVVRYGNVMGSRGSVIEVFNKQIKSNELTMTDKNMTRFNIFLDNAIELVLWSLENCKGGEIIVPKLKSFYVKDLARAYGKNIKILETGIRPGEKLDEEMISIYDSMNTIEYKDKFIIFNNVKKKNNLKFSYNSRDNKDFLSTEELKKILKLF
jgi:UDP-N-acetylglucosamine 4,6-dehydratase